MASLRVVKPGDKTPRSTPDTITEAIEGSARDVLAASRRVLAKKLDEGQISSNAIASVIKELKELDRQIRAMDAAEDQEAKADADSRRPRRSFNASAI